MSRSGKGLSRIHFVGKDWETTLVRWEALRAAGPVSVERLREFVDEFFDQPEDELVGCEPIDWDPSDDLFHSIKDEKYRAFAVALHQKWPTLYRKVLYKTLIYVPLAAT
ncbi:unnamed protein product, partial [Strongylus vulgaris]